VFEIEEILKKEVMKKNILLGIILPLLIISCNKQKLPSFDGERAFSYLKQQCDYGPRIPGSVAHEDCKEFLANTLETLGASVTLQDFSTSIRDKEYVFTNIIGSFYPEKSKRIFLGAHWDSRLWADRDQDRTQWNEPVMGANDAASGIAVLLEMAHILMDHEPNYGVDLLFFDAEDSGEYDMNETWCLGSQYFVDKYDGPKPEYVIIVDMIGDTDLNILIESFSYRNSPALVNTIWDIAKKLGIKEFTPKMIQFIYDDHYPFLEAGYEAVVIIDLDYPYWHTTHDTPDKCSPQSLEKIGKVLVYLLYS